MCSETALGAFLESGEVPDSEVSRAIAERRLFPCVFGAALGLEGVEELLDAVCRWAPKPSVGKEFAARVYKIGRDAQGARLTYLKVTGGTLRVKDVLSKQRDGEVWEEKVDQIRFYSGAKFRAAEAAEAGSACSALSRTP